MFNPHDKTPQSAARLRRWLFLLLGVLLLLSFSPDAGVNVARAQSRSVFWRRWDVQIDSVDAVSNRFEVAEIYDLDFTGTFRFGSRVIEMTNLDDLRDVRVYEAGAPLRQDCSGSAGTFCVANTSDGKSITYYFTSPITNGRQNFRIEYTVVGALRIYEGGDQLWWSAIPSNHYGFSIGSSTVTVQLPAGYAPRSGVDPVVTYGAPTNVAVDGTTVTAKTTQQIGGYENLEIRVQFPHHPDAQPPAWQSAFDQRRSFEENVQPLITLGLLALSLLVAIGGPLLFYTLWQRRGRDPQVGLVPAYLSELPSPLPPAVVGTLLDERADVRDVMSTLIDLAHRQYLVIEEQQSTGLFGIGRTSEFTFKRTDKSLDGLRRFEERLMDEIFGSSRMERSLDSLRNKFYTVIPQMQNDLYDELVAEGLFTTRPSATRAMWSGLGGVLLVLAVFGVFVAAAFVDQLSPVVMCFPFAVVVTGIVALVVAQFMPAKTRKGVEEAAKWNAFREYLVNLEKYRDVHEAVQQFDAFLPYAVAFGMDRSWMQKFRGLGDVPVPPWYYPTYVGGPWGRGYVAGTPLGRADGASDGLPGELARAGESGMSLDDVSGRLSGGLENISTGLTTMLESASRVMTSRPQSASSGSSGSWGAGGSSWSGGGFSGGGSSGGGSSGFG